MWIDIDESYLSLCVFLCAELVLMDVCVLCVLICVIRVFIHIDALYLVFVCVCVHVCVCVCRYRRVHCGTVRVCEAIVRVCEHSRWSLLQMQLRFQWGWTPLHRWERQNH